MYEPPIDAATADYLSGGGVLTDHVSLRRFRFYHYAYPVWPQRPGDGLYSYDSVGDHEEDLLDYNFALHYHRLDPLYYTPKRIRQLRCSLEYTSHLEETNLNLITSPLMFQQQMYREMMCSMSNLQPELNGEIGDAVFSSPLFQLQKMNTKAYKTQMQNMFNFIVNQQKAVILETFLCLKALGIYHHFACEDLIDLYSMSMYHPGAMPCHGCRKVNWVYHQADHYESEYMMCMTPECPHAPRKRDVPKFAMLAIPMHGFNLQTFYDQLYPPGTTDRTSARKTLLSGISKEP